IIERRTSVGRGVGVMHMSIVVNAVGGMFAITCTAFGQVTTRISVDSNGIEGNGGSLHPSASADGRYVAFFSYASNLVANDNNGAADTFLFDRVSGQTTRISVSATGVEGNGNSFEPSISSDGRYVAFRSDASNLVPNDNNSAADVFV